MRTGGVMNWEEDGKPVYIGSFDYFQQTEKLTFLTRTLFQ